MPLAPFLSRAWSPSGLAFIGATLFMAHLPPSFFSLFAHASPPCYEQWPSRVSGGGETALPWPRRDQTRGTFSPLFTGIVDEHVGIIFFSFPSISHQAPSSLVLVINGVPKRNCFCLSPPPPFVCLPRSLCFDPFFSFHFIHFSWTTSTSIAYTRTPVAGHVIATRAGRGRQPKDVVWSTYLS